MNNGLKVGRVGYSTSPAHVAFQDFDSLTIDLKAGEVRFERNGNRSGLVLASLLFLSIHLGGQRDAVLIRP